MSCFLRFSKRGSRIYFDSPGNFPLFNRAIPPPLGFSSTSEEGLFLPLPPLTCEVNAKKEGKDESPHNRRRQNGPEYRQEASDTG